LMRLVKKPVTSPEKASIIAHPDQQGFQAG